MTPEERRDVIFAFISNKCQNGQDGVTWKEIFEHCGAMEVTTNPNTLNFDLTRLRAEYKIILGDDNRWRQ